MPMTIFRSSSAYLLLAALLVCGLSGCLFEAPLTRHPSTNIDTRFLGVFEFNEKAPRREAASSEETGPKVHRVAIVRRSEGTYWIYYRNYSEKPVKTWRFIGWISRVDKAYYLTLQDDTEGSPTRGRYGFLKCDWKWPSTFVVYTPDMPGFENEKSSFKMRQAVRVKLKDNTLFPYEPTTWERIARTWWDRKATDPMSEIPKEFEDGTKRNFPGL